MEILLVDGYNMIGDWPDLRILRDKDLAAARDLLVDKMAEYQAYTGMRVIIVFDAHYVPGTETKFKNYRIEVIFTKENESADERIEKLAKELKNIRTKVHVATSDFLEQWVTFGLGALRKSARELAIEVNQIEKRISQKVDDMQNERRSSSLLLSEEVAEIFEKWRRGDR
ncbi:NYN domain-containing protein [Pseudalkalibacillus berkeleyi]|uniref:NYN domain-containing protein n=1 Tax=Pseudalkalibacillus berkeleyi TaxID=1069813 RepID=A0ABS9H6J7_9BACL|nr:NYN domain-containing protein [Pseudalkalibacillus berkeleyi]MCF6139492.1 NYN domain-containing protein [Pseudalkalibacillus berkeleyi]